MPRMFPLAEQVDGMSLLRIKSGASPKSLYLLKNAWITAKRTIQARPGVVKELTFPNGTVGVLAFGGKFHTFTNQVNLTSPDSRVVVHTIHHPIVWQLALTKIHKAFPFLGAIYVVAEFSDGLVQHYYVREHATWTANTNMGLGSSVFPTVKNGLYYVIEQISALPAWQANTEVLVGYSKQPTVANNFRYEVMSATGGSPIMTGNTEPSWPLVVGQQVIERRYVTETTQVDPGPSTPTTPPGGGGGPGGPGGDPGYGPFPPGGGGGGIYYEVVP